MEVIVTTTPISVGLVFPQNSMQTRPIVARTRSPVQAIAFPTEKGLHISPIVAYNAAV
ncbi:hypothetical protein Misp06_00875 [Microbulbifer sp. NBRC 101763]|uniref:hypothetical protein n=1 Tax=unclassified Microbulbifer TaxID=2619833 RepID=UPI0024ACED2A|nr:hypothetical protein [Microbulbifer sp. MLAF003]WHI49373.1 hypothetical protein P3339_12890 [Microbulbifer sp. MLAF003]